MENKSVYVLTSIMPEEDRDKDEVGAYECDELGTVSVYSERVGVFDSVQAAEDCINKLIQSNEEAIKEWFGWTRYFGFILDELYLNDPIFGQGNISHFESRRSYLGNGQLNCFSDLDFRCEKKFAGRDEPIKWVKPGDYAYLYSCDKIYPILIDQLSFTKEEWMKQFQPGVHGDFTDDSGISFTESGHEHPFSPDVFPLSCLEHGNIPDKFKELAEASKKDYYSQIQIWL